MDILRKHDWVITLITWILVIVGIITIYSITYNADNPIRGEGAANRQLIYAVLGFGIYFAMSFLVDYTYLRNGLVVTIAYLIVLALLIGVLVISQANRGSVRWISLGPLNLEPSELSKILLIIVSALFFKDRLKGDASIRKVTGAVFAIVPILALVFIQPDLSTTLSLLGISAFIFISSAQNFGQIVTTIFSLVVGFNIAILVTGTWDFYKLIRMGNAIETIMNLKWFIIFFMIMPVLLFLLLKKTWSRGLIVAAILGIVLALGYSYAWDNVIKDYQKERISTFINPEEDPLGAGYQVNQSIIATGSGHFWGRGFGRGTQSNLNFLPERHTDFIFASYAEEFGFVGTLFLLVMYIGLLLRIVYVGIRSEDNFGFLICIGVATMIFIQFAINVGMNIGLMPVTGITLPLMSSGGSSLLTTLIAIGLVQSVSAQKDPVNINDSLILRD